VASQDVRQQNSRTSELLTFVQDQNFTPPTNRACQSDYLALAKGEVAPARRNASIQGDALLLLDLCLYVAQARRAQCIVQHSVIVLSERIQIVTDCTTEKVGLLWNYFRLMSIWMYYLSRTY
jgi:hypothetical protein